MGEGVSEGEGDQAGRHWVRGCVSEEQRGAEWNAQSEAAAIYESSRALNAREIFLELHTRAIS